MLKFVAIAISAVAVAATQPDLPGALAGPLHDPLPVEEIAPGVFVFDGVHETFSPRNSGLIANMSFVIGTDAVAVIDTGGSLAAGGRLLASIRARTSLPVRFVVNTHMHPDHVFGNAAFAEPGVTFVGHVDLPRALAARGMHYLTTSARLLGRSGIEGVEIIAPSLTIAANGSIDLGGRRLELTAHATGHTDNDLTVYDPATATLWTGDLLFVGHVPALDGSITGWLSVMEALKEIPAKRAVPGHGPASVPWPQGLADQERYLRRIADGVRAAIAAGRPLAETAETVGREERGRWQLFDEFNARNVSSAYAELEWE
jgi:quinoprotein relay system zinc metallohydrolase 2